MKTNLIFTVAMLTIVTIAGSQRANAQAWTINGNAGTNPPTNFIGTTDNKALVFKTKNVERMRIRQEGNVGIGINSPGAKLHVAGGTDALLSGGGYIVTGNLAADNLVIDDNEIMARNGSSADGSSTLYLNKGGGDINFRQDAMRITNNKLVGIGTSAPTNKLHVIGNTLLNGHVSVGSLAPDAQWHLRIGTTTNNGFLMGTAETLEDFGGSTFGSNSNIVPTSDNIRSLGSSTNRWNAVWAADGTINTSDAKDKKNIRDLDYGLNKLMQLRPVKFNWKEGINTSDKVGLVAQELQKILPEVVRDYDIKINEATGKQEKVPATRLGVIYTDLIPVLIKSIQELQIQITELKKEVNDKASVASTTSDASKIAIKTESKTVLQQNAPNPFSSNTTIRYHVPASISTAQIRITDVAGNTVKTFSLSNEGSGSINVQANELSAGSYHYTLIVNGKKVDTKQMVIVK